MQDLNAKLPNFRPAVYKNYVASDQNASSEAGMRMKSLRDAKLEMKSYLELCNNPFESN